jgi:HAMP domain-containing protein
MMLWIIAACAFSAQVWAFRCCQELKKINQKLDEGTRLSADVSE